MKKIKTTHGGHWGLNMMDPGATGNGYKEAEIAYDLSKRIAKLTGAKEVSDRKGSNVNNNLYNLVNNMNVVSMGDNDFHISNHLNAFNHSANGVEVWYYAGDVKGAEMARKTSAAIAKALGLVDRGAKATTDLYVVANSVGHTLLIEWCFIDAKKDVQALVNNMDKAVNAMVGCFDYKIEEKQPSKPKPTPTPKADGYWQRADEHFNLYEVTASHINVYKDNKLKNQRRLRFAKGTRFYSSEVHFTGGTTRLKTPMGWVSGDTKLLKRIKY